MWFVTDFRFSNLEPMYFLRVLKKLEKREKEREGERKGGREEERERGRGRERKSGT